MTVALYISSCARVSFSAPSPSPSVVIDLLYIVYCKHRLRLYVSLASLCFRPTEFLTEKDTKNSSQIDEDLLPPSGSESEDEGDTPLTGYGNPNRQPFSATNDSESDTDSEVG